MLISILTGFAAGAIHVVGGVDHLLSMAPSAMRRPRLALRGGLAWGLGHSSGVLVLSSIAILVKDLTHIERMSSFAEFSVGIVLLVVGAIAIRTSFGLNIHTHKHNHLDGNAHEHVHFHFGGRHRHTKHSHAVTSLGLLHGMAGASHVLAVIPALALPPIGAVAYMFAYLFGSILAMGLIVLVVSVATLRAGTRALPAIIGITGGLSMITGFLWLQKTSLEFL